MRAQLNDFCTANPDNRYCPLIKKADPFLTDPPTSDAFVLRLHNLYTGDEAKVMAKYMKKYGEDLKNVYRPPKDAEEQKKEDDQVTKMSDEQKKSFNLLKTKGKELHDIGVLLEKSVEKDYDTKYDEFARWMVQSIFISLDWMKEDNKSESHLDFLTGIERFFDRFLMLHNDGKIKLSDDDLKIIKGMAEASDQCRPWYRRTFVINIKVVGLLALLLAIVIAYLIKSFFTSHTKK